MSSRWRIVAWDVDPGGSRSICDIVEFDSELHTRRGLLRQPMNRWVRVFLDRGCQVMIEPVLLPEDTPQP